MPSSLESALHEAILAINTADPSWSKLAAMCGKAVVGSAQFLANVVTLTLFWPEACWYEVINWIQPRPPWGMGAPCWFVTSKNVATVDHCQQLAWQDLRSV